MATLSGSPRVEMLLVEYDAESVWTIPAARPAHGVTTWLPLATRKDTPIEPIVPVSGYSLGFLKFFFF